MTKSALLKENFVQQEVSKSIAQILHLLHEVEEHTIQVRRKLMDELKESNGKSAVKLKLDEIK